jgi:hypothetical protein
LVLARFEEATSLVTCFTYFCVSGNGGTPPYCSTLVAPAL